MTAARNLEWSDGAAGPVLGADEYDLSWQELARCAEVDPALFFPEQGASSAGAKLVCRGCEVRAECLEYALATEQLHGVWGGLSENQRRRMRRDRREAAA